MKTLSIKISLYLNYFVFAILLNSVGIVISKSINVYNVAELLRLYHFLLLHFYLD